MGKTRLKAHALLSRIATNCQTISGKEWKTAAGTLNL